MIVNIGDRIRTKRKNLHMTQQEVASELGVAKQTVNRYETGTIPNIPIDTLKKLAKILGTTPSYLIGWDAEFFNDQATPADFDPFLMSIVNNYDLLTPGQREMFRKLVTSMFPELV